PEGYEFTDIHRTYSGEYGWITLVAATAIHLRAWYKDTQYCGRCGAKMSHHPALRAMKCECGNLQFPRIAPVVLAGIVKDDKIVATRYKGRPYKGLALNAGFVEIGESLEQALIREVEEEVGLKVAKLHYYGSQPWGHTGIEMAGFFVEIEGDDTITLDEDELSEAFWCSREDLPEQEFDVSLTATMFEAFRKKEFYLFK
ncbi:MAG: NUDIX domain-containing protein, partial [Eubacterium sp.]|nr:NUDIX domain-containing protein [Candidatus Colimonas fimequi]